MRIGITGGTGSGKTLLAFIYINEKMKKNKQLSLFTNCFTTLKHSPIPLEFFKDWSIIDKYFNKAIMLLDEAHLYWNARKSHSKECQNLNEFFVQTRKRKNSDLILTFQSMRQIDILGRENFELLIHCKPINIIWKNRLENDKAKFDILSTWIFLDQKTILKYKTKIIRWEVLKKYFGIYDTEELIRYGLGKEW